MKKHRRYKSKISEAVHEGAQDLFESGLITKNRMAGFDALCLEPIPQYTQRSVQRLRKQLNISQAVLAHVLNTSVSTVQKWENGENRPGGPSAKLLHLLELKGLDALH